MKTLSYEYRRLGQRFPHGVIAVCPKCGRRGASVKLEANKPYRSAGTEYSHHATANFLGSWSWSESDGFCFVSDDDVSR